MITIKRIYDPYSSHDGSRIFVDRMWARGLTKEKAHIDHWLKEIAPSSELRTWFAHDPKKWPEFKLRYFRELDANASAVSELFQHIKRGKVTLLYGAKDQEHNNALALKEYIQRKQ